MLSGIDLYAFKKEVEFCTKRVNTKLLDSNCSIFTEKYSRLLQDKSLKVME